MSLQLRDYITAVCRRWVWIGAAGAAAALVAVAVAQASAPSYVSSSSLFVGVTQVGPDVSLSTSSRVDEVMLPSLVQLARSDVVLGPVAARLEPRTTPADLEERVSVTVPEDTSVLVVSAAAPEPGEAARLADAVTAELRTAAEQLYDTGGSSSLLRLTQVMPAMEPRFPSSPATRRYAVAGLAVGLLGGVLLAGLEELVRPRIRDRADAHHVSGLPVLGNVAARGRGLATAANRAAEVERLGWLLTLAVGRQAATAAESHPGVGLTLLGTAEGAGRLAEELTKAGGHTSSGLRVAHTADLDRLHRTAGADHAVIVVDAHRTTARELRHTVTATQASPVPLLGVVVDGVLPARPAWSARLAAAVAGRAALGRHRVRSTTSLPDLSRVVALSALVALGLAHPLPAAATTGLIAAVVLLPVWLTALPRFRGAALLCALTALGLVSGLVLARWSAGDHGFSAREMLETGSLVVTGLGLVGVVLWARTLLPMTWIGCAYGSGALVTGLLRAPGSENAFKFELSLPLTIVVLSAVSGSRRPLVTVLALGVLGGINVLNDARSAFAFCVMAAALVVWQSATATGRRSPWVSVLVLGAMGVGAYLVISELLVSGALGSAVQQRSATQIAQTGSLLLGGRPEWTATWALMRENPLGFGLGTIPSAHDVTAAKSGFAVTNIPTAEGYIENYLFAGRFELHSIVADLWTNLGPAGLLLGLSMAVLLIRGLAGMLTHGRASGLICFLVPTSLFFLAFGPLPSNLPEVAFTVAMVLSSRSGDAGATRYPGAPEAGAPEREAVVSGSLPLGASR